MELTKPADVGLTVNVFGRPIPNGRAEELFETRHCVKCGQMFHTYDMRLKYCSDQCRPHDRATQAAEQRKYMEQFSPEEKKRIAHENYLKYTKPNGDRTLISCTICKQSRNRAMPASQREDYICAQCQVAIRQLARPTAYCQSCGQESGFVAGKPRTWCLSCFAAQSSLAERLNVSRQRVGQIVHAEIERAALYGETIAIPEAIRRVEAIRKAKKQVTHD